MPISSLINQLRQKITSLYAKYQHIDQNQKISAKFDRTLFSEDFQPLQFYLNEIEYTLQQITNLTPNQLEQANFLTEKLFAQCTALIHSLEKQHYSNKIYINSNKTSPIISTSTPSKNKYDIHKLPPKERLVKYYAALQALNDKLNQQELILQKISNSKQKQEQLIQIAITEQRKKRCLEAIELLEEYLTSRQEN